MSIKGWNKVTSEASTQPEIYKLLPVFYTALLHKYSLIDHISEHKNGFHYQDS